MEYTDASVVYTKYQREIYISENIEAIYIYYIAFDTLVYVKAINGVPIKKPFWVNTDIRNEVFWDFSGSFYSSIELYGQTLSALVIDSSEFKLSQGSGVFVDVSVDNLTPEIELTLPEISFLLCLPKFSGKTYIGYGYVPDYKGTYEVELDM